MPKITLTVIKVVSFTRAARRKADLIRITVQKIREVHGAITAARSKVIDIRARMETLRNSKISQEWSRTAEGAIFQERMRDASRDLQLMIDLIHRLLTVMDQSAQGFTTTQTAVKGVADALLNPRR